EELRQFTGQRLRTPACFIGGASDWGVFQVPGAIEAMETTACADYRGTTLIEGAGHWVQQEAPMATIAALLAFFETLDF
ncbi:MAG: alpha/beta hydrolase, partial [Pseudomonadota bacterium]